LNANDICDILKLIDKLTIKENFSILNKITQIAENYNINNIKIDENVQKDINDILSKFDINMRINENYRKNWEIEDAIREIIQNQRDSIIVQIRKENMEVKSKGNYYFVFKNKNKDELYGEIKYDKEKKELMVSNKGFINENSLSLGSQKHIEFEINNDIIGRFGEGMKITILTFLRFIFKRRY
jgi:hypothetical protein